MKKTLLVFLLLMGCQTPPTKVKENLTLGPNEDLSRLVEADTVILDARLPFSFFNGHLPEAQLVQWEHFSDQRSKGFLRKDLDAIARHLSLLGVSPERRILVLGLGANGQGEEGRIAWMLAYLGVKSVYFASESAVEMKRVSGEASMAKNSAPWKVHVDSSLALSKKEFLQKSRKGVKTIDVRSAQDYLKRALPRRIVKSLGSLVNIPFPEFLDARGLPKKKIVAQLQQIGMEPNDEIIVMSEQGVKSAHVVMVLRALGYRKATHFPGGWKGL